MGDSGGISAIFENTERKTPFGKALEPEAFFGEGGIGAALCRG